MTTEGYVSRSISVIGSILALVLFLSACEEEPKKKPSVEPPKPEKTESRLEVDPVGFDDLPGWQNDELDGFVQALMRTCERYRPIKPGTRVGGGAIQVLAGDWMLPCDALSRFEDTPKAEKIRGFLEAYFRPFAVRDGADIDLAKADTGAEDNDAAVLPDPAEGLFTGYFEAELLGSRKRTEEYRYPLYGRPADLLNVDLGRFDEELKGKHIVGMAMGSELIPYADRAAIQDGHLDDQDLEILWINDPVDVFLLQVQGSGRVILSDGDVVRVGFAAHNGLPYKSIGRKLIDDGEIEPHAASWQGIREWVETHPERMDELFAHNPRYIFFRQLEGPGPIGAQGVALTPKRSLAVDRRYIPLGLPVWLDTVRPGSEIYPLRRLMVAQDTGGAIKGVVRGDFFWGYGEEALDQAGRMKSRGRYFLLLPNKTAERLRQIRSVPAS